MSKNRQTQIKSWIIAIAFVVVTAILICVAKWVWDDYIKSPPYVDSEKYPIRGIDVSSHNGKIDFKRVKEDGIEFVFIKASEGKSFRDKNFVRNYSGAELAGLPTGAYHFFRYNVDGLEQARNFLTAIGNRHPELGLAIDVEDSYNSAANNKNEVKENLIAMREFLTLNGYKVIFYTNRKGYLDYIFNLDDLNGDVWISSFSSTPLPAPWTFWQYDHHGHIDGIHGDVDLNVFCGNRLEWSNYLQGRPWPYE